MYCRSSEVYQSESQLLFCKVSEIYYEFIGKVSDIYNEFDGKVSEIYSEFNGKVSN